MGKIEKITSARQKVARKYLQKLAKISNLRLPSEPNNGEFNFQSFIVLLPKELNRNKIIKVLADKNIETVLGTYAQHSQPSFRGYGYKPGDLPNSFYAQEHSLTLPLYGSMIEKEINYVVKNFKKVLEN